MLLNSISATNNQLVESICNAAASSTLTNIQFNNIINNINSNENNINDLIENDASVSAAAAATAIMMVMPSTSPTTASILLNNFIDTTININNKSSSNEFINDNIIEKSTLQNSLLLSSATTTTNFKNAISSSNEETKITGNGYSNRISILKEIQLGSMLPKEMEIIPQGKHFRLVDDSELPEIMNILGRYLPESLKFHQTIKTYLNDRVWQFYFYVSKKWPEEPICLHFPGCTLTPHNNIYESIGIFCPTSHIKCVDLLEDENLIDWKKPLYLNYTHKGIMDRMNLFYKNKGTMDCLSGDIYTIKDASSLSTEELSSNEVVMKNLTVNDCQAIHDLYPASEIECVEVFQKLVNVLPGVGIFTKDTNELAAWMVHSYYGAMFSMQTKPEFRRKGYGIHLARNLTRLVIERGYSPFVVIRPENDASKNLYIKLGFEKVYETERAKLTPFEEDSNGDTNIDDETNGVIESCGDDGNEIAEKTSVDEVKNNDNSDKNSCNSNRDLKKDDNIHEIFENKCKVDEK